MAVLQILLRWWAVVALVASAAMLGAAHWFESQGLAPCQLCLRQREVYWAALAVAGPAIVWTLISRAKGTPRLAAFILFAIFTAGAVTAAFHAGGEQGWWALPATCMGATGPINATDILASLEGPATMPSCGDIAWSWLGLSMATWNAILSVALAGFSLAAAMRPRDAQVPRLYREP
ncbi:disulfide bond formation protein B [Brevundimonas aveniformis]|uniref:disulfide bond formation protein B n=1 Tax=Brevundimonas aveniformis TaxID=370977 RepID=UPI0004293BFF|nr:disulfide bond formation protein B [Brevundimonas aveniformis]